MKSEQPTPRLTLATVELQRYALDRSILLNALQMFALVVVGSCLLGSAEVGAAIGDFLPARYWLDHLANVGAVVCGAWFVWRGLRGLRKASASLVYASAALDEEPPAEKVEP